MVIEGAAIALERLENGRSSHGYDYSAMTVEHVAVRRTGSTGWLLTPPSPGKCQVPVCPMDLDDEVSYRAVANAHRSSFETSRS